jgi:polysaccharide pyruvyl transferase CsaB
LATDASNKGFKESDLLVSGGGSVLQDVTGLKSVFYYLGIVFLAKCLRKKVVFFAQGIGPVTTYVGKRLVGCLANHVDLITVRDEASASLLAKLGVKRPPLFVTADAVLSLEQSEVDQRAGLAVLARAGITPGEHAIIGVSVRAWQDAEGYKQALAQSCDRLIERGYRVVLLPFHYPCDLAPSKDVIRMMKHGQKAVLLDRQIGVQEMLGILGQLHLMIGMRLHALIMAAVMGVPVVGISYDPKVDSFLQQVEQPLAGHAADVTADQLWVVLSEALEQRDALLPALTQRIKMLKQLSHKTVKLTMELLDGS